MGVQMSNNQKGLPTDALAAIVSIIGIAWGIGCVLSWLIGLITN